MTLIECPRESEVLDAVAAGKWPNRVAFELAEHAITVNTILPGAVITPGATNAKGPISDGPATRPTPFGFQQPHEIGAAVLFFASPTARPITNQVLAVDGGFSVS